MPPDVAVVFVPERKGWNDFGFRVRASIGIRTEDGWFDWVSGLLAFKNEKDTREALELHLKDSDQPYVYADDFSTPYASQLGNARAYGLLTGCLGVEGAIAAASACHDAGYWDGIDRHIPGWLGFYKSSVFAQAFMRLSETAYAHENAVRLLRGAGLDLVEDAREDFVATVQLGKSKPLTLNLRFPVDGISPGRINVFIGRNGRGKTASLRALSRGFMDRASRSARLEPTPQFNQVLVFAHSQAIARFRMVGKGHRSEALQTFRLDPARPLRQNAKATRLFAAMARNSAGLVDAVRLLDDLFRAEFPELSLLVPTILVDDDSELIKEDQYAPLQTFYRAPEGQRLDSLKRIDASRPMIVVDQQNQPRRLSLGQEVFVHFLLNAVARSGPASVFLIDEPENFLHPNLVSRFVRLLDRILDETKSIAVVATHSPFIVREVAQKQVQILDWDAEGAPAAFSPRLQTFGANVGSISDQIFGDDIVEHLFESMLESVSRGQDLATIYDKYKDELSLDAWMILRERLEMRAAS